MTPTQNTATLVDVFEPVRAARALASAYCLHKSGMDGDAMATPYLLVLEACV